MSPPDEPSPDASAPDVSAPDVSAPDASPSGPPSSEPPTSPGASAWKRWLVHPDPGGPATARLFHAVLALVSVGAWLSLWSQVELLLGWKGLTPVQMTLLQARGSDVYLRWLDFPSHLFFSDSDASLVGGCAAGVVVSTLALVGVAPRLMLGLNALLYLGYCVAAQTFLGFQWDNLLIEACLVGALLSRTRPSPAAHWMGRALLFKVFFESGLAKLGSRTGDWLDGSAMAHYYETSPLPTPLAWYAHNLPTGWHTLESWWTLCFELVLAWGVFAGRVPRTVALAAFGSFLVVDFATANYGFFVPLAAALCLLLLSEQTSRRVVDRLRHPLRRPPLPPAQAVAPRAQWALAGLAVAWAAASVYVASVPLAGVAVDQTRYETLRKWRVANAYHLFSNITTARHEPELQTSPDGETWRPQVFHYKAGPVDRAPPFVAPHQPRVDFRLWFFGLNWQRYTPPYVANLLRRVCWDPDVVQPLFDSTLPDDTRFVRFVYWDHHFTDWATRSSTGAWWTRDKVGVSRTISCDQLGW